MNRKIITELERAREIMGLGLEPKTNNLLTEQAKYTKEFLEKLFIKGSSNLTVKASKRISKLMSAVSKNPKINTQYLERVLVPDNIKIKDNVITGLRGSKGEYYNMDIVRQIIERVSNGTVGSDTAVKLKDMLKYLPEVLFNGQSFKKEFSALMKSMEREFNEQVVKKAEKEALEKAEKEAAEKASKTTVDDGGVTTDVVVDGIGTITITRDELGDLIEKNVSNSGRGWFKDIKFRLKDLLFGKNVAGDVALLKNNALLKFLKKQDVQTMGELLKLLKNAQNQAIMGATPATKGTIERIDINKITQQISALVKENSERIAKQEQIYELPPGLVDEVQSLFLLSNYKNDYFIGLNTAWVRRRIKDLTAEIKNPGKKTNVEALEKERADLLEGILGTNVDEVLKKNLGTYTAQVNKATLGGLSRWAVRDFKNIAKTMGFLSISWAINAVVSSILDNFGGAKSIAGLTKQFYEKFRGHKWMVKTKGGLSDANAKNAATILKKHLRGWALIRDWSSEANFEDRLKRICGEDDGYKEGTSKETIMGCTEENKLKFWNETVDDDGDVADWGEWASSDDVGVFKFITGVNDMAIIEFYKDYVPTILAASQITYFYEDGESYTLLDDLNAMSSIFPVLGILDNLAFKTKGDVRAELNNNKPWVIGEGEAGADFALAVEEITANWPQFASTRKSESGAEYYSAYKTGAAIPPAKLASITEENNYVAGSFNDEDIYVAPKNFNLWLDALTVEEFEDGFCANIESNCEPYLPNKPVESSKLKGYDIAAVKEEVTTVLKELIIKFRNASFWNGYFGDEDKNSKEIDSELGIKESTNTKSSIEGLAIILLNNLNKK